MEARGQALEEYLAFLREGTSLEQPLVWHGDDADFAVAYVGAADAERALARLPERRAWSASATNIGGIVIIGRVR